MAKWKRTPVAEITTRDPVPQTRDPEPAEQPEPEPERSHRQQPVIVRVDVPKCPKCGYTVFRGGGNSKPNISTMEMLRYRQCAHCGRSFYLAVPMTDAQAKAHV